MMRPPWWKYWLSYVFDLRVEEVPSSINPHLFVNLSRGRYQLTTSNAIYSFADLYGNFLRTFDRVRWEMLTGDEVLLLGLGLGSIPYMLERKFNKSFHYTGVEVDEEVIYLINKYVLGDLKRPLTIYHADAVSFMQETTRQWDLVCVDLFVDDEIPSGAFDSPFLYQIKETLSNEGLLLYNTLARTTDDIQKSRRFLDEVFMPVFPDGGYLDVGGNWILINDNKLVKQYHK